MRWRKSRSARAAQDAANTGQGAVQIRFATRSGSNEFRGSTYYYLRHYKLNANTWFNNRDLPPDPATGKAPKNEDKLYQPGTRLGGPIVIPGSGTGATRRSSSSTTRSRARPARTPRTAPSCIRARNRASSAGPRRPDPRGQPAAARRRQRPARDGRSGDGQAARRHPERRHRRRHRPRRPDRPAAAAVHLSVRSKGVTKYPTGRLDFNLTEQAPSDGVDELHRSALDAGYHEQPRAELPRLPGHRQPALRSLHRAGHAAVDAGRRTWSTSCASAAAAARRCSRPRSASASSRARAWRIRPGSCSTSTATSSASRTRTRPARTAAREAGTKIAENTLNWLKGSHSVQLGRGVHPGRRLGREPAARADDHLRRRQQRSGERDVHDGELRECLDGAAERCARALRDAGRPRQRHQRRAAAERERPVPVPRARAPGSAAAQLGLLPRRQLARTAEPHPELRAALRAAAAVPRHEQQLFDRHASPTCADGQAWPAAAAAICSSPASCPGSLACSGSSTRA